MAKTSYIGTAVVGSEGLRVFVLRAASSSLPPRAADEAVTAERAEEPEESLQLIAPGIFEKADKTRRKTSDEATFAIIRAPFGE
jgi:hypothetical protein